MTDVVLRYLHVQWWVPFVVWFGLYIFVALGWIINGYSMEYLGWRSSRLAGPRSCMYSYGSSPSASSWRRAMAMSVGSAIAGGSSRAT